MWQLAATCRGTGVDAFFGPGEEWRAMCERCPVLEACRAFAFEAGPSLEGNWGGLTKKERAQGMAAAGCLMV